ncbi:MAG: hypothetical protein GEU98_15480 [Pseudonocardiaceae bacterium]|nr:hypothetical protein [Pseudonocardiaceae bacterium]
MTAPHDDRVRGFPAFPAGKRRRGGFARSWWGNAWIKAMEETSLDQSQLKRGRSHAYAGHVGPITVSPGRIAATVRDHHDPHHTRVFVEQLGGTGWQRLLDRVAAKAGHIAALLDGDMPHELAEAADDAGVPLLPTIGELEPECGCPGWEHPCQHAAALCYQVSWLLDADPFVLLLIRGRGQRELLDELRHRNVRHEQAAEPEQATAGMQAIAGANAREAYATDVAPLPADPPPVTGPELPLDVPEAPGVRPDGLRLLVADAAARARELLAADDPPAALDAWQDAVRMAATHPDDEVRARLSRAGWRPADEFERAVRVWEYGGRTGLKVLEAEWTEASGPERPLRR